VKKIKKGTKRKTKQAATTAANSSSTAADAELADLVMQVAGVSGSSSAADLDDIFGGPKKKGKGSGKGQAVSGIGSSKSKRQAEVVVFNDPTAKFERQTQYQKKAKGVFMSSQVSKVHVPLVVPERDDFSDGEEGVSLTLTETDILKLGSSQFDKKTKKDWNQRQLVNLGARAPEADKAPLAVLQGMRKKQGERAQKQKELDIATGMCVTLYCERFLQRWFGFVFQNGRLLVAFSSPDLLVQSLI
jgi:hypothetical protein